MKTKRSARAGRWAAGLLAVILGASLGLVTPVGAKNLAVNQVNQRVTDANGNAIGNNWCWAASSKMVLDFYGYPKSLAEVVAYGLGDSKYDSWNYFWGSGSETRTGVQYWEKDPADATKWILKTESVLLDYNGIDRIVANFSGKDVQTQRKLSALTAEEITKEIDERDAPFFVRIGWQPGGGHFMVCYGTAAGTHEIRDPWFGSYSITDAALRRSSLIDVDNGVRHTWTHTLTTSKILDILFLFDTTGSMGGYINNAKANAVNLLNNIAAKFKNYRVAVANYRDYPEEPYGDESDYVYAANLAFTDDKAAAVAAINSLSVGGGADIPESVYTALSDSIAGLDLADGKGVAWRDDPARRIIILIGDAPGHDPEPWPGGSSYSAVKSQANNARKPVAVHCLLTGTDIDARNQYKVIASATGGTFAEANTASEVSGAITAIVDSVAANDRRPVGDYAAIYPAFFFDVGQGLAAMGPDATKLYLEVQRKNAGGTWDPYLLQSLKKPAKTSSYVSKKRPFEVGTYRWRLQYLRKAGKLYLPDGTLSRLPKELIAEGEEAWTEFNRVAAPPAKVKMISPAVSFTPEKKAQRFEFGSVPEATGYVLQVLRGTDVVASAQFKSAKDKNLRKSVGGLEPGTAYTWRVQALNFDRPVVDDTAW